MDVAAAQQAMMDADSSDDHGDIRLREDNQQLIALAHVPTCYRTTRLIRAATSGWSAARHWLHHKNVRTAAHTVMLASERLRRSALTAGGAAAATTEMQGMVLPHMPPELWLACMRFFLRSDWKRVGQQQPAQPVPTGDIAFTLRMVDAEDVACQVGLSKRNAKIQPLVKPFVKTTGRATMQSMQKFLKKKLDLDHYNEVEILCREKKLPPHLTLDVVKDCYWQAEVDLELTFRQKTE